MGFCVYSHSCGGNENQHCILPSLIPALSPTSLVITLNLINARLRFLLRLFLVNEGNRLCHIFCLPMDFVFSANYCTANYFINYCQRLELRGTVHQRSVSYTLLTKQNTTS